MDTLRRARTALAAAAVRGDSWLLVWFAVYLMLMVEPYLIYQAQQPPFAMTREFAQPLLLGAGGLLRYAGLFLAQCDASSTLGALVRVCEALFIGLMTDRALAAAAGRRVPGLRFVPMALFMLLCGRYDQPLLAGPLLVATLGAVMLFLAGGRRLRVYLPLAMLFQVAAAGAAGPLSMWLALAALATLCACAAARATDRPGRAVAVFVVFLLVPPLVAMAASRCGLHAFAPSWTYAGPRSRFTGYLLIALLGFYPVAALLVTGLAEPLARCWQGLAERRAQRPPADAGRRRARPGELRLLGNVALVGLLSLLATRVTVDEAGGQRAYMDYCALHGQWRKLLAAASARPVAYDLATYDINRALFDQGLLARSMFAVPQRPDSLLLTVDTPYQLAARVRLADQYIDLGRLHLAEYVLHNTLVMGDNNPFLLSRLARVYLIDDRLPAARLYLTMLLDNLVWRRWARERLRQIEVDPSLNGDPEIQRLRSIRLTEDDLLFINRYADRPEQRAWYIDPEVLAGPLRCHPRHRMAFEYLVSYFLLAGRPNFAAAEMHRLRDFGETALPRAWAEGALVALDLPGPRPDLSGLAIDEATSRRYGRFKAVVAEYDNDLRAALPRLEREFAGTYFLYVAHARLGQ